jgi:hypothetical protein
MVSMANSMRWIRLCEKPAIKLAKAAPNRFSVSFNRRICRPPCSLDWRATNRAVFRRRGCTRAARQEINGPSLCSSRSAPGRRGRRSLVGQAGRGERSRLADASRRSRLSRLKTPELAIIDARQGSKKLLPRAGRHWSAHENGCFRPAHGPGRAADHRLCRCGSAAPGASPGRKDSSPRPAAALRPGRRGLVGRRRDRG